jgi:hypothetical protein
MQCAWVTALAASQHRTSCLPLTTQMLAGRLFVGVLTACLAVQESHL